MGGSQSTMAIEEKKANILHFLAAKRDLTEFELVKRIKAIKQKIIARMIFSDGKHWANVAVGELLAAVNEDDRSPISIAIRSGNTIFLDYVFKKDLHTYMDYSDVGKDLRVCRFLMLAIKCNNPPAVKILLEHTNQAMYYLEQQNAPLETVDRKESFLHVAAELGHTEVLKILIEALKQGLNPGDGVTCLDKDGYIPLHLAIKNGHEETIKYLKEISLLDYSDKIYGTLSLNDSAQPHYAYALMCKMSSNRESTTFVALKGAAKSEHEEYAAYLKKQGWERMPTSEKWDLGTYNGYFGVAYCRKNSDGQVEVVIAHRGTNFDDPGNVLADAVILAKDRPLILNDAMKYVQKLFCDYDFYDSKSLPKDSFYIDHCPVVKITHTGFSLGGFIAASCAALTNNTMIDAVTFDAPGIKDCFTCSDTADTRIINYVTTVNQVNTCNEHVGNIRRISFFPECSASFYCPETASLSLSLESMALVAVQFLETTQSHNLSKIIQRIKYIDNLVFEDVYKWPTVTNKLSIEEKTLQRTSIKEIFYTAEAFEKFQQVYGESRKVMMFSPQATTINNGLPPLSIVTNARAEDRTGEAVKKKFI